MIIFTSSQNLERDKINQSSYHNTCTYEANDIGPTSLCFLLVRWLSTVLFRLWLITRLHGEQNILSPDTWKVPLGNCWALVRGATSPSWPVFVFVVLTRNFSILPCSTTVMCFSPEKVYFRNKSITGLITWISMEHETVHFIGLTLKQVVWLAI